MSTLMYPDEYPDEVDEAEIAPECAAETMAPVEELVRAEGMVLNRYCHLDTWKPGVAWQDPDSDLPALSDQGLPLP
ncbi:hypothetical protein PG995_002357 [Apiospora arundinis]